LASAEFAGEHCHGKKESIAQTSCHPDAKRDRTTAEIAMQQTRLAGYEGQGAAFRGSGSAS